MTEGIIISESNLYCNYGCSVRTLFSLATHPLFLILIGLFWILGRKSAKLADLIREQKEKDAKIFGLSKKYPKQFKMPWEHKLSRVEDKENF